MKIAEVGNSMLTMNSQHHPHTEMFLNIEVAILLIENMPHYIMNILSKEMYL